MTNPFHFREHSKFSVGDFLFQVVAPALPLLGLAYIGGSFSYIITEGGDETGVREEAIVSAWWGVMWQMGWLMVYLLVVS